MREIGHLEQLIRALDGEARAAAGRILAVATTWGNLAAPEAMRPWIERNFGSLETVESQRIVRVTDLVTMRGSLFNDLRSRRPLEAPAVEDVRDVISRSVGDPFCDVDRLTPADPFGRVRGRHGVTAANLAKYDGHHAVLVFDDHDPLAPAGAERIRDHLDIGRRWAEQAHASDPEARYYFLLWNALWRAGGSIVHGHMQLLLARGMHYPQVEALRRAAHAYASRHRRSYFDDLWLVHDALGLGVRVGEARVMASLTPVKEREVIVLGRPGENESVLAEGIAHVIRTLRARGMLAHNLALYVAPLAGATEDWSVMPTQARIVDRGDPADRTSDIGAMELYAASVISSDPFQVAAALAG